MPPPDEPGAPAGDHEVTIEGPSGEPRYRQEAEPAHPPTAEVPADPVAPSAAGERWTPLPRDEAPRLFPDDPPPTADEQPPSEPRVAPPAPERSPADPPSAPRFATASSDSGPGDPPFRPDAERGDAGHAPRPSEPRPSSPPVAAAAPPGDRPQWQPRITADPADPAVAAASAAPAAPAAPAAEVFSADPAVPAVPAAASAAPKVQPPTHRRRLLDDPDDGDGPRPPRRPKVRARKVRRIVRHVEPWSVLKVSVLFFLAIFLIICVASAVLWNAARSAGAIDDVESFITSLGFGNCEDIAEDPSSPNEATPTTVDGSGEQVGGVDSSSTTIAATPPADEGSTIPDEDGECREGQRLVGGFKFEDQRIFQAFALGGVVLVLAGAATAVVLALLFNLISDLTGGVRVTVLEEEPSGPRSGSPPARTGD